MRCTSRNVVTESVVILIWPLTNLAVIDSLVKDLVTVGAAASHSSTETMIGGGLLTFG